MSDSGPESAGRGLKSAGGGPESGDAGLESAAARPEWRPESGLESLGQRILALLLAVPLSKSAVAGSLGHRSVSAGLNRVIRRLLQDGLVAYTVPDKPNSRLQKYRITRAGQSALEESAK